MMAMNMHICMYVCMYVLFKLFIFLKEFIMIIKTHNQIILNMYNLFYISFCRQFVLLKEFNNFKI